jgi:hypothetical protein
MYKSVEYNSYESFKNLYEAILYEKSTLCNIHRNIDMGRITLLFLTLERFALFYPSLYLRA